MSNSVTVKSFNLTLDKIIKGRPTVCTLSCVYSSSPDNNTIGYVLGVNYFITEIRCPPLGNQGELSFCSDGSSNIGTSNAGFIVSRRIIFTDKGGQLSAFMMQGENGEDIVATANVDTNAIQAYY